MAGSPTEKALKRLMFSMSVLLIGGASLLLYALLAGHADREADREKATLTASGGEGKAAPSWAAPSGAIISSTVLGGADCADSTIALPPEMARNGASAQWLGVQGALATAWVPAVTGSLSAGGTLLTIDLCHGEVRHRARLSAAPAPANTAQ